VLPSDSPERVLLLLSFQQREKLRPGAQTPVAASAIMSFATAMLIFLKLLEKWLLKTSRSRSGSVALNNLALAALGRAA
jgi:hypothetical protein